jgi:hypothetical protein
MRAVQNKAALTLAILLVASTAQAGPWTKNPGQVYVKVGEGFFLSDSFRDGSGQLVTGQTEYLGATTSTYFEVGVLKGLHVWGYLPYTIARNDFNDGSSFLIAGGGDALLGLQYTPPLPLPFPAALKLEAKVPFYDVADVLTNFPAAGDGQLDLTFWLSAGGSLHPLPLFFFGEVGYRKRTEYYIGEGSSSEFLDGVALFTSVGYTLFKRVTVALNMGGIIPFEEDTTTKGYLTLGPALYVPVWKGLAVEASFDPMIYTNRNASPGIGFSFGVSFNR